MRTWNDSAAHRADPLHTERVAALAASLRAGLGRRPVIMEVCGTHTAALSRSGLRRRFADLLDLRSGPGCPVCVTSRRDLDRILALARSRPGLILATFGDMMRVPGSRSSLAREKAEGADIRAISTPFEAITLAEREPDRLLVMLAAGFETTAAIVALAVAEARRRNLNNFLLLPLLKLIPPVLASLLALEELALDGLLLPGHVSAVIGLSSYRGLPPTLPAVAAGFEPLDLLAALQIVLEAIQSGRGGLYNAYPRAVSDQGNRAALARIDSLFAPADVEWRGLGVIPGSGLALRPEAASLDASRLLPLAEPLAEGPDCGCGRILSGLGMPTECRYFGRECRPADPLGPCMVSAEGACAVHYRYEPEMRQKPETHRTFGSISMLAKRADEKRNPG